MAQAMETLGYINKEPSLYEPVTRAKARNLIDDMALRRLNTTILRIFTLAP